MSKDIEYKTHVLVVRVKPSFLKEIKKVAEKNKVPVSQVVRVALREGLKQIQANGFDLWD